MANETSAREAVQREKILEEKIAFLQKTNAAQALALAEKEAELQQLKEINKFLQAEVDSAHQEISDLSEQLTKTTLNTANTLFKEQNRRLQAKKTPRRKLPSVNSGVTTPQAGPGGIK